jgi:TonB family protein
MFTTLVESRAVHRRSVRGAGISVIAHTLVIASAVALTYPTLVDAHPDSRPQPSVVFVPVPPPREVPRTLASTPSAPPTPSAPVLSIPVPTTTPTSLPPIDLAAPSVPEEKIMIGGGGLPTATPGTESAGSFLPGSVLDAGVVDRVPRIVGNAAPPRYPDMLRQSGATGQVIVRFVVDTLGRAELGDLLVVESTHPLFASAVKSALLGYRFTPGEAAGRKVRTMVQIPFNFTLK